MISILVSTHGSLGEELVETSKLIIGEHKAVSACCLKQGDDIIVWRENLKRAVEKSDLGEGVLLLTDIFGGSPSNSIAAILNAMPVECITGVNLPMLLEAIGSRESAQGLPALVEACKKAGRDNILDLRVHLNNRLANSVG